MRLSRFSRCALRFFSFAGMGIARRVGHSSRSAAIYRRRGRESFNAWRLHSEPLEGRAMMAAQSFSGVTLDLDIASDTFVASFPAGAVSTTTDNYTSDTTPAINVIGLNGIPMTAGDVIQIVDATVGMVGAYTVLAADLDFSGAWKSGTLQITTNALSATSATGTVHSLTARHVDNSTLPGTFGTASDPLSVTIDTKGASVTSVTSLNTATAGVGQKLQFLVTFSEPVKVSGLAKLPIIVGSGTAGSPDNNRDASFDSQPSAVTAIFSYTVTDAVADPDSNDIDGVAVNGPISGGSILDRAANVLFSGDVPNAPIQTSAFVVAQGDIVGRFLGVIQGQYMVTSLSTIRAVFDDDNDPTTPSPSQGVTGSGNAVVERSDFTLTRDGEIVPLTGATLTWPIAGSYAFADFQLGNLDSVTNQPGTYRLTFNDLGIAPAFDISWVKSTPTAGELIASLSATPSDPTPATPRSAPVNSVDVKFQDNAGNAVPVTGVDTSKVGSQITQFTLWKNGVQVAWPSGATVTGSGAGYSINGLAAAQVSDGSYQVTLNNDPLIQTLAGTQMITTYSTSWQYVNPKTIQSVAIPSGTYTRGQRIPITVTFNDVVNVPVGSAPTMTLTIGSTQVTTNAPVSGSGSNVLVFGYDVVATDLDVDGITMAPAITGTINDGWGNAVIPTFTVPGNLANVKVDGVAPTVTSVAPPAPGNYNATAGTNNIDITLNLSEASFVSGSPSIPLTIGGAVRQATYVNGGGAVTFQFGADTVTRNAHGLVNGTVVSFSSITTTTGITANTNYYVVNATTNTFQLANTAGGAAIDLTGADGTGTVVPATNTLVFRYTIASTTDVFANGSFTIGQVSLNGATVRDTAGNDANLAFTAPTFSGVNINRSAPAVTITSGSGKTSKVGDVIEFTATFAQAVTVTGSGATGPAIAILIGGTSKNATYTSGTGTTAIKFQYIVQPGDLDTDGIAIPAAAIALGSGTITDSVGTPVLSFAPPTLTTALVDGVAPTVSTATGPAPGNYENVTNKNLDITLTFNEAVNVVTTGGTPSIPLTIGGAVRQAAYSSGTGTNTLVFRYQIASATDVYANGSFTVGSTVSLNGGTIKDTAGNDYALAVPAVTIAGVNINRTAPSVTITSGLPTAPATTKTSKIGDVIELTATFAQAVNVTGAPTIAITVGGTSKNATYVSGTGTTAIKFQYIVQLGDLDTDGISIPGAAIVLGTGTITDSVGTPILSFAQPADLTKVLVDGVAPQALAAITGPTPGVYTTGGAGSTGKLTFVVSFDDVVTVVTTGGTPTLTFTLGGSTRQATYASGSASGRLAFEYTIAAGDSGTTVAVGASPLSLSGGTIKDANGNNADLSKIAAATFNGVAVNRLAPAASVSIGDNKTSKLGDTIELSATFGQIVYVTGATGTTPSIAITVNTATGSKTAAATYVGGSGTTTLKFRTTVAANDLDTDGIAVAGDIDLGAAAIKDAAGNDVSLVFTNSPALDTSKVKADGVVPQALAAITGPAPGVYTTGGAGSVGKLTFVVPFDDAVTVTGTPRLTFTLGGSTRQATYASGTGTSQLTFDYTIVAGDAGTSVAVGADPLSLTGGTIRDANGNDADLSKIAAGTFNGVAVNRLAPAASVSIGDNKTSKLGDTIELAATFGQIVNVTGSPTILGTINTATGSKAATFTYVSGSGTTALKFRTTVAANDLDTDGIDVQGAITLPAAAAIKDAAGNDVSLVFTNSPALDTSKVKADGVVPSVVSVTPPAAANYTTGNTLSFTVNFNESVLYTKGTSDATLAVTINGVVRQATYDAASSTATTAVFKYSIVDADASSGSITIGGITLFGSTFRDAAGNDATLTGTTGSASGIIINRTGLTTVTASDSKTYKAGEVIEFTATFSGTVTVTGTPTIAVTVGANPRVAAYASGSGTSTLKFRYTVQTGELDPDGIELPSSTITLPAGSNIVDAASNTAALSFVPPATTGVLVDAVVPAAATIVRGPGLGAAINRVQATQSSGIVFVTGELDATIEVSFSTGSAVVSKSLTGTGLQQAVVLTATDVANVGDGTLTVSVSQLDAVGNRQTVPSAIVTFTLDGTAPAAATIARGPGIGLSINRAQATQTSGVVVVSGELNATITVTFSRTTYTVTKTLTGTGTTQAVVLTDAEATILGDGDVTVSVTQADALGNAQTDPAASVGFKLDATVPGATTLALGSGVANGATEAEATQDSGVVIVNGESGATITVTFTQGTNSITKTLTGDGTAQPVVLTLADIETLGNGLVSVTATQVDAAGNTQSVPASTTAFRLDTIAPSAPRVLLGPGVTNGATLAEATQADGIVRVIGEAGAAISVTFTRGSTTISRTLIGTGAAQAVTLSPGDVTSLGNGVVTVSVNQTDAAGNPQAEPNAVVSVTIDTGAPSAATLALGDGVTGGVSLAEATQTDGVVTVTGESSAAIQVTFRRGTKSVVKNLTGTGAAQAVVLTTDDIRTLGNGTAVVSAIQTDAAGNRQTANASTLQFTLDATAPGVASLALGSGVSNGATQAEATQATGVVTVLGESGATVAVTFTRGRNAVTKTVTGNGATPVAVVLDSADVTALGDGIVTVSTVQADAAGNPQTAAPATLTFTLDTSAPSAPAIAFGIGVATGATAAEATQAGGAVRVTGEPGAAIVVTFTQNAQTVTKTLTGTGSAQPVVLTSGDIAALGDGSITVKAKQTDTAGNVSSESTTSFTLETRLPSSPSLALASDTGSNAADGVTSNTTVNVSGVGTGGSWQYSINGGAFWSPSLPASATSFTLPAGTYPAGRVQVRQTSQAGNLSAASRNSVAYVVDAAPPTVKNITSSAANGTYGVGQPINIQVVFTERVFVTGAPRLELNTIPARYATYSGGSGANILTFTYTPQLGDSSADLSNASSSALLLNDGGSIRDLAGNDASLTLAGPGVRGSLGFGKNIVINAIITASSAGFGNSPATAPQFSAAVERIQLTFNVEVTDVTPRALRLYRDNLAVPLDGATITGSGKSWTLTIPSTATDAKGRYRLDIGGPFAGVAIVSDGVQMDGISSIHWRRV